MDTTEIILKPVEGCALKHVLTPAQQLAMDGLMDGIASGDVCVLRGSDGAGKSTILERVQGVMGGALIGARELLRALSARHPVAIEEMFFEMMENYLADHDLVILDDLHLLLAVVESYQYGRPNLLNVALTAVLSAAHESGKKLLFGVNDEVPQSILHRARTSKIADFTSADYARICQEYLGNGAGHRLDYDKIHRFAPKLNAYQLKNASVRLRTEDDLGTDRFVEYLTSEDLTSNVELDEVEAVDWKDLKGLDDLIRALEAKIALPFENDELAAELHLKPKRGVLLAGPPGTGKTTIGRALAHRLKSKFFLIDGTVIAGSCDFYGRVSQVFEAAKRNAPSIIFIDDADVMFEGEGRHGFYRYLLTMLDGLESASAGRVCVMMTAMDASTLPQAVLRSGRVELWLETRLPDEAARTVILGEKLSELPFPIGPANVAVLAGMSRGLTGADLKAVIEDGKLLYAHDKANEKALRPGEEYFLEAIEMIRKNRRTYARKKPLELGEVVEIGFRLD
jgi:ATP-dependent 26S proteasome regulatory subunit